MWFKNEKDWVMIQLTVTLNIRNTYFNEVTLKMAHLRLYQGPETVHNFSSTSKQARNFSNNLGTLNRESAIDKLLKAGSISRI